MGESLIARYLISRGNSLLPVYELEMNERDKGPRLLTPKRDLIAPDCLVLRNQTVRWVEAKRKTCFTWHRITQRWVTGIDLHCYEHYLAIREQYNFELYLLFFHSSNEPSAEDRRYQCPDECPTGLYGQEILYLKEHENHRSGRHGKKGMVYWHADVLTRFATAKAVLAVSNKPPGSELAVASQQMA